MVEEIAKRLREGHGVIPVIGVELEWTIVEHEAFRPVTPAVRDEYLEALREATASLPIYSIDVEKGGGQVEAALLHTRDLESLIRQFGQLKTVAHRVADTLGKRSCFLAKPFADDFGNGLHVHVHLENETGELLYWKKEARMSDELSYSLGGLIAHMKADLPVFAGSEAAYARYIAGYHAPVAANWGMNNRTAALRIPDGLGLISGMDAVLAHTPSIHRRIEHRVASAEASLKEVLAALLLAVDQGLREHIAAPSPTYGEASHVDAATLLSGSVRRILDQC